MSRGGGIPDGWCDGVGAGGVGGERGTAHQGAGGAPMRTLLGVEEGGGVDGLRGLWGLGAAGGVVVGWEEAGR